jgi:transposase
VTLDRISLNQTIANVEQLLKDDPTLSPALNAAIQMLIMAVQLLADRAKLDSRNSSKPPTTDPHRARKKITPTGRKAGGQPAHAGSNLEPIDKPDVIHTLKLDKRRLPKGTYHEAGFETRQVIDIHIERCVTEYRAQILQNEKGQRFVAEFPPELTRPIQYGASVKANAVYLSMFQLIPYERVQTQFAEQYGIALSTGSLSNFNQDAYQRLADFELLAKRKLLADAVVHADETGINVNGKRIWLHSASSANWSWFYPHAQRGHEAMDAIGILPHFSGTLVHDHWKPYYRYSCTHALCNAHHLRELTYAEEIDGQQWAKALRELLLEMNSAIEKSKSPLSSKRRKDFLQRYRRLLQDADTECPEPDKKDPHQRGRLKRSKSRNLLLRLRDYEADVLRFLMDPRVPFTNNQGERDIRMSKVQQKISGCFRSMEGAYTFCLIRSYLSTCRKHGVGAGEALDCLFKGTWPEFIQRALEGGE